MEARNRVVEVTGEGGPAATPEPLIETLPFGIKSWQEIIASETATPANAVEGLLEEGSTSLLVARQKEGKSMLAAQLAIDVADGEPFLGRLQTKRGRVLYVDYENRAHRVKARGLDLARGRNVQDVFYLAYDRISERELGLDGKQLEPLKEAVKLLQPALLVIDPLRLSTSIDFTDPNKVVDALRRVSSIQDECPQTAILLVHHRTKSNQEHTVRLQDDPRAWIDRTYGSQALIAHVETIIGLERDTEGLYTLATVPRSSEPLTWMLEKEPDSERYILADSASQMKTWPQGLLDHWRDLPTEFSWSDAMARVGNSTFGRLRRRAMPLGLLTQDLQSKRYRKTEPARDGREG